MRTKARSVVMVAFDEVELLDLAAPLEVLSVAGRRWNFRPYKVQIAAAQKGLVATRNQLRVEATQSFAETAPAEILIIPGGYGARKLAGDAATIAEIARLAQGAEIVAAIGNGVLPVIAAGLLGDAKVALSAELAAELAASIPVEQRIEANGVVDAGRIVSARASGDALAVALSIVARTMGPKLVGMVEADLGLEPHAHAARVEIKY